MERARSHPLPRLAPLPVSLLDVKLAWRMLAKYPGLTLVAVFALAIGIPASLAPTHLLNMFEVTLPFEDGERIVGLRHRYIAELEPSPGSIHEFTVWRGALTSFEHVGAARSDRYNLIAEDGRTRPYRGSRMSASSFAIVRVTPLMGRPLIPGDELTGAPDVVVLGFDAWQSLFDGDRSVVGRSLRVGGTPHTVVGVMPEGFLFPENDHFWIPLRGGGLESRPGEGPDLWIYGRLADGVTETRALAEMTAIHRGLVEQHPTVYTELRPEIVPFTYVTTGNPAAMAWIFGSMQLFALVLLAVACGNVGTLVLARTAARSGEIAVRTALGASRARIVSQLFVESLVLALLSTGIGLLIAAFVAERVSLVWYPDQLPFWFDFSVDRRTVLPALGVAVFCAVVAGVLPALKATSRGIRVNMERTGAGHSSVRFGRATTALIVAEVAIGVVCLFAGVVASRMMIANTPPPMQIRAEQFLAAELRLPEPEAGRSGAAPQSEAFRARLASVQRELVRRLTEEPGVRGVALAEALPKQFHSSGRVEVEGDAAGAAGDAQVVLSGRVDVGFFAALEQPIYEGRDFAPSDLAAAERSTAVIVNTTFVDRVLRGRNPIGQRIRYAVPAGAEPGPWYEIVGVVGHLGMIEQDPTPDDAGLYHPGLLGALYPLRMAIHLTGDPTAFAGRLREIAGAVDPEALILNPVSLDALEWADRLAMRWTIVALGAVAAIAIVLSVAGLYAIISFTVVQRTHEIGVRAALGADSVDIMGLIVRRALGQLAVGITIGVAVTAAIVVKGFGADASFSPLAGWPLMLGATAVAVVLIGVAACVVPTLRGLRIRPIEALRM